MAAGVAGSRRQTRRLWRCQRIRSGGSRWRWRTAEAMPEQASSVLVLQGGGRPRTIIIMTTARWQEESLACDAPAVRAAAALAGGGVSCARLQDAGPSGTVWCHMRGGIGVAA
eukprot:3436454-Rhodomonas_salina.4